MSARTDKLADDLIRELGKLDQRADRAMPDPMAPDVSLVNVWADGERYPIAAVAVSAGDRFNDYAWGRHWEHSHPIDTPVADIAAAIVATTT